MLQEAGEAQQALLALQAVMAAAPATPGLLQRLQAAAALALRHRGGPTAAPRVQIAFKLLVFSLPMCMCHLQDSPARLTTRRSQLSAQRLICGESHEWT